MTGAKLPSWNPQTSTPIDAPSESALAISALSGTTTDPVIRNRNTMVPSAMISAAQRRAAEQGGREVEGARVAAGHPRLAEPGILQRGPFCADRGHDIDAVGGIDPHHGAPGVAGLDGIADRFDTGYVGYRLGPPPASASVSVTSATRGLVASGKCLARASRNACWVDDAGSASALVFARRSDASGLRAAPAAARTPP